MDLDKTPEVKSVLMIVDHFTRYMRAYVTKDQKVSMVTKCLYEGFISIFGAPKKLITDQDMAFTSKVVYSVWGREGYHNALPPSRE